MKLFKKAKKGFTLVELVVVIAVIAILAAVSVGAYFGVTESANNSQAEQEAKALHTSIMLVVSDPESGFSVDETNGNLKYEAGKLACANETHAENCGCFEAAIEGITGLDYQVITEITKDGQGNVTTTFNKPTIAVENGRVSYFTTKGYKYGRTLDLKKGTVSAYTAPAANN